MPGRILQFDAFADDRGLLVALEAQRNIPFEIRRVYYMTGLSVDQPRGLHAHRKLRQVAICLSGSCRIVLDDGRERTSITLDSPSQGLVIEAMTWREMHGFSDNCVLLVLASEYYEEVDYIRDYDRFLAEVRNGQ
jgi:dTDP-4-dehydrorhamnose 3,5-epimerase-like enzyme